MRLRLTSVCLLPLLATAALTCVSAPAQQLIGYVNTRDADVSGASDVLDGQAVLTGSVKVSAKDHTAPILLGRGGTVRVCQTSVLHLTESRAVSAKAPLLFSLDRGAIEIQMAGNANDSIMTPDLRFTVRTAGPMDLRLRVGRNGDTCVENRGPGAPTLAVSDPFGEAMYEVSGGQHVLFEHGSLHEVVDHESSSCGCPEDKGLSLADAMLASGGARAALRTAPAAPPAPTPVYTPPAPVPVAVSPTAPVSATLATTPPPAAPTPAPRTYIPPPPVPGAPSQPKAEVGSAPPAPVATQHAAVTPSPVTPAPAPRVAAPATPAPPVAAPAVAAPPVATAPPAPDPAAEQAALQAAEQKAAQAAIRAAEEHPFPEAISEGLAPTAEVPQSAPGEVHAQVSTALAYNPTPPPPPTPPPAPAAAPPAPKQQSNDLVHILGRFFKHLFGG